MQRVLRRLTEVPASEQDRVARRVMSLPELTAAECEAGAEASAANASEAPSLVSILSERLHTLEGRDRRGPQRPPRRMGSVDEPAGGSLIERVRGRRVYLDAVTSELALAEVLVVPYRIDAAELIERYERLLAPRLCLARIAASPSVWRAAARLRAETRLRLPDAVHLATAEAEGCAFVVTGDKRLVKASTIPAALVA